MANVLLGVTGSVAAIKTPELFADLRRAGHDVKVVATQAALYFFDPAQLDSSQPQRNRSLVILDEDEWPGRDEGRKYQRNDEGLRMGWRESKGRGCGDMGMGALAALDQIVETVGALL